MLTPDGRILLADPAGWLAGRLAPPLEGCAILPSGVEVEAEPLDGGGWVIREPAERSSTAYAAASLQLRVLGHGPYSAEVGAATPVVLSVRHAEILALLAMHPEGLTCRELTLHLYGERGKPISTRAEMSRLRRLMAPVLSARPYRLSGEVTGDFLEVERQLSIGNFRAALETYRGPLLPSSRAPGIEQARDELEAVLARAVRSEPELLWRWLKTEHGRRDEAAMASFIRSVPAADPRRAVVAARLSSLQVHIQAPA